MTDLELPGDFSLRGARVDVYRNLHEDCYSIRSRDTDSDEYGNVIGHADGVLLRDAEFVVQEAGQAKCRETGTKNVHAVVRGELQYCFDRNEKVLWKPFKEAVIENNNGTIMNVWYDPFECDHFEINEVLGGSDTEAESGDKIHEASYVLIGPDGVEVYVE